ncbi:flippase [Patescibacteria group bacterium]|nr:flippase [Patescibacteria group bacterium]
MSLTRKIAHNTLYQIIGRGGGGILAVVGIAFITRYLGREGFGIYTTITAFLMFFGIVVNFGITTITVQMISERDDGISKLMSNIFTLRLISSAFFLSLAPIASLFFPYPTIIKVGIAITSFAFLFQMLTETIIGIFQKYLQMHKPAMAEFFSRIVFVILIVLFVYLKYGILSMMVVLNIANFIWFAITFYFARKLVKFGFAFDWDVWREVLRRSWPIGLSIILNLIYLKTDVLILSVLKNQEAVGLYGAPYKLIDAVTTFAMMFMGLILPLLAASWVKQNMERFEKIFQKTLAGLIVVIVPMVVGVYFIGTKIMVMVAGKEFAESGIILSILILGAGALFIGSLFAHTIVALDKQKMILWGYAVDAAISLVLYFIFIPKYSYIGAAWVTVFSEVMIALVGVWVIYRVTGILPKFFKIFAKSLLAAAPMAAALYFLQDLHVVFLMMIAMVVYGIFIILFKGVSVKEIGEVIKLKS